MRIGAGQKGAEAIRAALACRCHGPEAGVQGRVDRLETHPLCAQSP
ncbi:MAG: hypothetical protein R8L07_04085 [Alphaproteobacteria bacterium]|nr:hypothetical protein [Alphaproteobacteria bacterium]